jgi:hypothetical protein
MKSISPRLEAVGQLVFVAERFHGVGGENDPRTTPATGFRPHGAPRTRSRHNSNPRDNTPSCASFLLYFSLCYLRQAPGASLTWLRVGFRCCQGMWGACISTQWSGKIWSLHASARSNGRCAKPVQQPGKGLFGYSYPMWIGWDWKKLWKILTCLGLKPIQSHPIHMDWEQNEQALTKSWAGRRVCWVKKMRPRWWESRADGWACQNRSDSRGTLVSPRRMRRIWWRRRAHDRAGPTWKLRMARARSWYAWPVGQSRQRQSTRVGSRERVSKVCCGCREWAEKQPIQPMAQVYPFSFIFLLIFCFLPLFILKIQWV